MKFEDDVRVTTKGSTDDISLPNMPSITFGVSDLVNLQGPQRRIKQSVEAASELSSSDEDLSGDDESEDDVDISESGELANNLEKLSQDSEEQRFSLMNGNVEEGHLNLPEGKNIF